MSHTAINKCIIIVGFHNVMRRSHRYDMFMKSEPNNWSIKNYRYTPIINILDPINFDLNTHSVQLIKILINSDIL